MTKKLLAIPFLFVVFAATGQNDFGSSLQKDSLYYKIYITSFRPRLILNRKNIRHKYEKDIFKHVPASLPYYKKYKNNYTIGLVSTSATVLSLFAMAAAQKKRTRNIFAFSTIGLFINSELFLISGAKNLRKAVRTRNQAVLKY